MEKRRRGAAFQMQRKLLITPASKGLPKVTVATFSSLVYLIPSPLRYPAKNCSNFLFQHGKTRAERFFSLSLGQVSFAFIFFPFQLCLSVRSLKLESLLTQFGRGRLASDRNWNWECWKWKCFWGCFDQGQCFPLQSPHPRPSGISNCQSVIFVKKIVEKKKGKIPKYHWKTKILGLTKKCSFLYPREESAISMHSRVFFSLSQDI